MQPSEYLVIAIGVCAIPMAAMLSFPSERTLRSAWFYSITACVLAVLGVIAIVLNQGLVGIWAERLSTDVLNPISLGHVGASLCILAMATPARNLPRSRQGATAFSLLRLTLFAAGGIVIIVTGSRGPLFALFLAICFFTLFRPTATHEPRTTAKVTLTLGMVAASCLVIFFVQENLALLSMDRFFSFMDSSNQHRMRLISQALAQFAESPFVGDAMVVRTERDYPHNVLIEALMALGIGGFLVILGIILFTINAAVRILRHRPEASWLALIAIQHMSGAMFSRSLYSNDSFWVFTAAAVAAAASNRSLITLTKRAD